MSTRFGDAATGLVTGFATALNSPGLKQKRQEKRQAQGISNSLINDFADTPYADIAEKEFKEIANNKNSRKMHTALYSNYATGNIDIFHKDDPQTKGRKVRSYPGSNNFVFSPKPAKKDQYVKEIDAQNKVLATASSLAQERHNINLSKLNADQRGAIVQEAYGLLSPTEQRLVSNKVFGKTLDSQVRLKTKVATNMGLLTEIITSSGVVVQVNETVAKKLGIAKEDVYKILESSQVNNGVFALLTDATNYRSPTYQQSLAVLEENEIETKIANTSLQSSIANSVSQTPEIATNQGLTPEEGQSITVQDILQEPEYSTSALIQLSQQRPEGITNERLATELTRDILNRVDESIKQNEDVFRQIQTILFDRLEQGDVV